MNQLGSPRFSVNKGEYSNEDVSDVIRMPGKEWQETQFYNSIIAGIFQFHAILIYAYNIDHFLSTSIVI